MSKYIYKCPFCDKRYFTNDKKRKYNAKKALYDHIEDEHPEQLNGLSPAQVYFNYNNKKSGGKCIICRKPTEFNEKTERYERLCSDECREEYRKRFKERMVKTYGKETLLNDPEQQKKMLANRKISGVYTWENGYKHTYTGSYEKDFLEFMELFLQWENPGDIMLPAPQIFDYIDKEGKKRFYIPDVFISSLNLIIEIKGSDFNNTNDKNSNKHEWRKRESEKEIIKDDILKKQKEYNYLKIIDKDYSIFFNYLYLKIK